MGSKDDIKEEISCNGRDQPSYDGCLPTLGLHDLEQQANKEKGIDEEPNLFKRKCVSCYGCQDDHDIPPSKGLLTRRLFYFSVFRLGLKKDNQRKDKHDEARTKREKTGAGVVDCAEFLSIRFNTGDKRKQKPEKITIEEK